VSIFRVSDLDQITINPYLFKYCSCRSSSLYLDNYQCYAFVVFVGEGGVVYKIWNKLDLRAYQIWWS